MAVNSSFPSEILFSFVLGLFSKDAYIAFKGLSFGDAFLLKSSRAFSLFIKPSGDGETDLVDCEKFEEGVADF